MERIRYTVKSEDIRNPEGVAQIIKKLVLGKNIKECSFEPDFINISDPQVTMSTGLIYQNIANAGFAKIVIHNHKNKDKLKENPVVRTLIEKKIMEIR